MKQAVVITFFSLLYLILTPGFQCENRPLDCNDYRTDTAVLHFSVNNAAAVYQINDSIRLFSVISDTIQALGGNSFINPLNTLNANINLYKVIYNGSSAQLNYANNEFNAFVQTGSFQNMGGTGFQILYNRVEPFNTLRAVLVPGQAGLYLVTVNLNHYSWAYDLDLRNNSDRCIGYKGIPNIASPQQQKQYWDSIGTTTLALANNTYNFVSKANRNYFFVKVIP